MNQDWKEAVAVLTEESYQIISGCYKNIGRIFALTDESSNSAEISSLAEAFGRMAVKVEAREYTLEQTIAQLKDRNAKIENLNRVNSQLTYIFLGVVFFLTAYTFILGLLQADFVSRLAIGAQIRTYAPRVMEILALLLVIRMVLKSGLPLRDFGLNLHGWRRAVVESVAVSAAVILALGLLKWSINAYWPGIFREKQIFSLGYFGTSYLTYFLVAPVQEFITRGTVQHSLAQLLSGSRRGLTAVLATSLLFSSLHVYSSIHLAAAALFTGWLWGWMYQRQQTLIGVSISHFLVGNAAGLMGYWVFF